MNDSTFETLLEVAPEPPIEWEKLPKIYNRYEKYKSLVLRIAKAVTIIVKARRYCSIMEIRKAISNNEFKTGNVPENAMIRRILGAMPDISRARLKELTKNRFVGVEATTRLYRQYNNGATILYWFKYGKHPTER